MEYVVFSAGFEPKMPQQVEGAAKSDISLTSTRGCQAVYSINPHNKKSKENP